MQYERMVEKIKPHIFLSPWLHLEYWDIIGSILDGCCLNTLEYDGYDSRI